MENRLAQLRYKEIVSVADGSRFGYVGDMEIDLDTGRVTALVVPGRLRLLDCWVGKRTAIFLGMRCAALAGTSFW